MAAARPRDGSGRACLALLGLLLGFPITAMALISLYVGIEDRLEVDDPVTCGGDPMPRTGYTCLNGGDTYENIVKERYDAYERSPTVIAISAGAVLLGAPVTIWSFRALSR